MPVEGIIAPVFTIETVKKNPNLYLRLIEGKNMPPFNPFKKGPDFIETKEGKLLLEWVKSLL